MILTYVKPLSISNLIDLLYQYAVIKGEATIMISSNGWMMLDFESYPNWTITFLPINT